MIGKLLVGICLVTAALLPGDQALGQDTFVEEAIQPSVTAEYLEGRIADVQKAVEMEDVTRDLLLDLYRTSAKQIRDAERFAARSSSYEEALASARTREEEVQGLTAALLQKDPSADLDPNRTYPLDQIENWLGQERSDLADVAARRFANDEKIQLLQFRTGAIEQRQVEAARRQEETLAVLSVPAQESRSSVKGQARMWVLETLSASLAAEIRSLDLERRSSPARLSVLMADRDYLSAQVDWIGKRITALEEISSHLRKLEAENLEKETAESARLVEGLHPLLVQTSLENAEIGHQLAEMVGRFDALSRELSETARVAAKVAADFQDAERAVESGVGDEDLGPLLLKLQDNLPDEKIYRFRAEKHRGEIPAAMVQRLDHQTEARSLADIELAMTRMSTRIPADEYVAIKDRLKELLLRRQILLHRILEADEIILQRLENLSKAEMRLLDVLAEFEKFLASNLLWLRSAEPTGWQNLKSLPTEIENLVDPVTWAEIFPGFTFSGWKTVATGLALVLAIGLFWKRRALEAGLFRVQPLANRPGQDNFGLTFRALGFTILAAAPLPLVLIALGWEVRSTPGAGDMANDFGTMMVTVAVYLAYMQFLRFLCLPNGLAIKHFKWKQSSVSLLRKLLDRYMWAFMVAIMITAIAVALNPVETGGTLARLGFLVSSIISALFTYRLLKPKVGIWASRWAEKKRSLLDPSSPLWWFVLTIAPVLLGIQILGGFVYSANVLMNLFHQTIWLVIGLIILTALATRALLVTERRLAYQAAREKRLAAIAAKRIELGLDDEKEDPDLHPEDPEVDYAALSDDSRELVIVAAVATFLVGFLTIWSAVLPALNILNEVTLWDRTLTIDGEARRVPITLASLGLALILGMATSVLAKRLPALVEIFMLKGGDSSGSRYTATTLTRYAIIALGSYLVVQTLGAQWDQFQWLVAALGVGIGFGLQEIVANFISGLIMLFERPVRVGDVITIGDTDGVVTRIQIRATTILGWDHKELVVPNREFITGRVLNWTLSDRMIRITLEVGVAYGTDVDLALQLMKEAAVEQERVLDDPSPVLSFERFGDSSLCISLRAFIASIDYRLGTVTGLNNAIDAKFKEAGIVIAFPQRYVYLDTPKSLRVRIDDGAGEETNND